MWRKDSLTYWTSIYNVRPVRREYDRALFSLTPTYLLPEKIMGKRKMTNDYVREVLTVSRANFFSDLGWTREAGFYLAGGTALAIQIGHRTSVDFDFYTQHHFSERITRSARVPRAG